MRTIKNTGGNTDLREMLLAAGVGHFNASLGIQLMNFLPMTTDPYAQGTIQIVQGLQRLLNKRGARLEANGRMGTPTVNALMKYSGPRWYDRSWSQIYGDVMDGRVWESWDRESRAADPEGLDGWSPWLPPAPSRSARFSTDSMGHTAYHHLGAVSVPSIAVPYYCSVQVPQGNCTPTAGVAKPMNTATLVLFQQLQRAVNGLLAKLGGATAQSAMVSVDGRIGDATVRALKLLLGIEVDHEDVARQSPVMVDNLSALMTARGATVVPDPPSLSSPSVPGPGGSVINPPDGGFVATMLQNPLALAAVAVGGLLLFRGSGGGKSKSRRKRKGR